MQRTVVRVMMNNSGLILEFNYKPANIIIDCLPVMLYICTISYYNESLWL